MDSTTAVVLAEVGVVLLEGTVIALSFAAGEGRWAYAAALLANACSFGIGLLGACPQRRRFRGLLLMNIIIKTNSPRATSAPTMAAAKPLPRLG